MRSDQLIGLPVDNRYQVSERLATIPVRSMMNICWFGMR